LHVRHPGAGTYFFIYQLTYMKQCRIWILLLLAGMSFQNATAQASDKTQRTIGIKTQYIQVVGDCHIAKHKIEHTAKAVEGVKSAVWNQETQTLTVKYSVFKKDAMEQVQRQIAAAGFNKERTGATDSATSRINACCCGEHRSS
jgi:periplasmic mercuric ion binding protein